MQREKGRRTELELCHLIREFGLLAARQREMQYTKCGVDVVMDGSVAFQCKSGRAINVAAALREAVGEGDVQYAGMKRAAWVRYDNDTQGFVVLPTGDFLKLYCEAKDGRCLAEKSLALVGAIAEVNSGVVGPVGVRAGEPGVVGSVLANLDGGVQEPGVAPAGCGQQ
jgi:hypothetical protein